MFSARFPRRRKSVSPRRSSRRSQVERLESRTLLAVNILDDFAGQAFADKPTQPLLPPDTNLAVGEEYIVQGINSYFAVFDRQTGAELASEHFEDFFKEVGAEEQDAPNGVLVGFDPKVAYDELTGRFIITALEVNPVTETSHILLAVSNSSDPTESWEKHRIEAEDADKYWADWTALGWDADAYYVTVNMFGYKNVSHHHLSIFTFDKESLLDSDNDTVTYYDVDRNGNDFTMWPALMHGAEEGDPMYFVEASPSGTGSRIRVIQMTDKLSADPAFSEFKIQVPHHSWVVNPSQPDGTEFRITNIGTRMLSAAWRNDRLVTGHHVGTDGLARARWYEIDTSGLAPVLVQSGEIDPGPGVHSFLPSIDIAPNGDLGMTYAQSSTDTGDANDDGFEDGNLSMYITGRKATDPLGTMHPPVLIKAGEASYSVEDIFPGFDIDSSPYRVGDFSGTVVDPVDGTFWAANEYTTPPAPIVNNFSANSGTWIVNFSIADASLPVMLASTNDSQSGVAEDVLPLQALVILGSADFFQDPEDPFTFRITESGLQTHLGQSVTLTIPDSDFTAGSELAILIDDAGEWFVVETADAGTGQLGPSLKKCSAHFNPHGRLVGNWWKCQI